jgi:hypothetical protein
MASKRKSDGSGESCDAGTYDEDFEWGIGLERPGEVVVVCPSSQKSV